MQLAFDFSNFIGRFHPILVHFPIGFLVLAIFLEWYQRYFKKEKLSPLIAHAWLFSAIGGAFAAFCGWYLAESGLYLEDTLTLHRWVGIAVVIISFFGWWVKKNNTLYTLKIHLLINVLMIGLISWEGHMGGNLTHGESYLYEYAPSTLKNMFVNAQGNDLTLVKDKDSIFVFEDLITPIFNLKCIACHNNEVKRGGLNMSHPDSIKIGGETGPAFLAGNSMESELFKRVTLSQKSLKFMPPIGDAMTYPEIQLLDWWISNGANFKVNIKNKELEEPIKSVLLNTYGVDTTPKPWYLTVSILPLDSTEILNLIDLGFTVKNLGANNPLLDVKYNGSDLDDNKLQQLMKASKHITWLSFAKSNISNDGLQYLEKFTNLTRLQLEKTEVGDEGIRKLAKLEHIEALNLYGTKISNTSLDYLAKIQSLKRVYLWQTDITASKVTELKEKNKALEVIF